MTACSNHPGTQEGTALKKILAQDAELAALVSPQLNAIATTLGLTLDQLDLLLEIDAGHPIDRHSADAVALQARLDMIDETATRLTRNGILALAEFGAQQASLLDQLATNLDLQKLLSGEFSKEQLLEQMSRLS